MKKIKVILNFIEVVNQMDQKCLKLCGRVEIDFFKCFIYTVKELKLKFLGLIFDVNSFFGLLKELNIKIIFNHDYQSSAWTRSHVYLD